MKLLVYTHLRIVYAETFKLEHSYLPFKTGESEFGHN